MKLTRQERETHIWYSEADATATIYTEIPADIRRLSKLPSSRGAIIEVVGDYGLRVTVPKRWVKVSSPREMTEAQLAHLREMRERSKQKEEVAV